MVALSRTPAAKQRPLPKCVGKSPQKCDREGEGGGRERPGGGRLGGEGRVSKIEKRALAGLLGETLFRATLRDVSRATLRDILRATFRNPTRHE